MNEMVMIQTAELDKAIDRKVQSVLEEDYISMIQIVAEDLNVNSLQRPKEERPWKTLPANIAYVRTDLIDKKDAYVSAIAFNVCDNIKKNWIEKYKMGNMFENVNPIAFGTLLIFYTRTKVNKRTDYYSLETRTYIQARPKII